MRHREEHGRTERPDASEQLRRAARVAGLRDFSTPSLEAVERRRIQLWILAGVVFAGVAAGLMLVSVLPSWGPSEILAAPSLRVSLAVLSIGFCVYSVEKELQLQRLTRLLTDERVLIAALTNRLHEVSLLLDAGRAMNAVLALPEVLETILRTATELLGARGGSVMLEEDGVLVATCVRGREEAAGTRVALGQGIAGTVAIRREAMLIQGHADPMEFPGLADREPYVESAMSVPMINRDEVVGVLNVNAAEGRAFTQYDLRALSVFAEQAAGAIANSRLFEAQRTQTAELDRLRAERRAAG